MQGMATPTKKPPAPPKLPAKEDVAKAIDLAKVGQRDSEEEGTAVEQLRSHLQDAHESLGQALDLLDEIEPEEQD